jgi:two-component system, cell cycle response regulator
LKIPDTRLSAQQLIVLLPEFNIFILYIRKKSCYIHIKPIFYPMQKKILLIDDSSVNNLLLQNVLEDEKFSVLVAFNGKEGLDLIKGAKPDLILLDIMMPRMDGIEVLQKIVSDEATNKIPVIMLTAKTDKADRQISLEMGAVDFITKPVNIDELLGKINTILGL